jgi:hypothetical protein
MSSKQDLANPPPFRLMILESPYAGNVAANIAYARQCVADCLRRGDAPFASHILYTQPGILDDTIPAERKLGIKAGLAWGRVAEATVVYTDRGISAGMRQGIERALAEGRPVEYRSLNAAKQEQVA